jgi:hypothetical protein
MFPKNINNRFSLYLVTSNITLRGIIDLDLTTFQHVSNTVKNYMSSSLLFYATDQSNYPTISKFSAIATLAHFTHQSKIGAFFEFLVPNKTYFEKQGSYFDPNYNNFTTHSVLASIQNAKTSLNLIKIFLYILGLGSLISSSVLNMGIINNRARVFSAALHS